MKDNLGWNLTNHKLHSNDAFIRIGILQAKIMRKQKTVSQVMNEIKNISSWNIQQNKNRLFAQRVRTFSKNIGSIEILTLCLQNLLPLFPSNPPQPRLMIVSLIPKCYPFLSQTQILNYLSEAVVLIGKEIHRFKEYGIYCCLQFCKLTQVQSEFYLIFRRCLQFLQQKVMPLTYDTSKRNLSSKQYEGRQFMSQIQQIGIKGYKNIKLKEYQKLCIQQVLQLYMIGSIKCQSEQERQKYKWKLQNLVDALKHYGDQQLSQVESNFNKFIRNRLNECQLGRQRIRKLTKKQKQYHIKLQNLQRRIYIPPIVFGDRNELEPARDDLPRQRPAERIINARIGAKNITGKIQTPQENDITIGQSRKSQIKINSQVYLYSYHHGDVLKDTTIEAKQNNQIPDGKGQCSHQAICQKAVEAIQQPTPGQEEGEGQMEQIIEQCQKASRGTSQFYSKVGQFGTTCDSAQFNSFQFDESPELIIKVDSETEQELSVDQHSLAQKGNEEVQIQKSGIQIQNLDIDGTDIDIDQILANQAQLNTVQASQKQSGCNIRTFNSTESYELEQPQLKQAQCHINNQSHNTPLNRQQQSYLVAQLVMNEMQSQFLQVQRKFQGSANKPIDDHIDQQYLSDFQIQGEQIFVPQKLQPSPFYNQNQKQPSIHQQKSNSNHQQLEQSYCPSSYQQFDSSLIDQDHKPDTIHNVSIQKRTKSPIHLVYCDQVQLINKFILNYSSKIYFFYRFGHNCQQKSQIIGYLSRYNKFNIEHDKLVFIFPFDIFQNLTTIKQKIINLQNYSILGRNQKDRVLFQEGKMQQIENCSNENSKNRIIVYGLWVKNIQSHLKMSLNKTVQILNYVLYEIFYENDTFDAVICLSQSFPQSKTPSSRQNPREATNLSNRILENKKFCKQIGKIEIKNMSTKYWNQFQMSIETIIGHSLKLDAVGCITVNQSLNEQQVLNII